MNKIVIAAAVAALAFATFAQGIPQPKAVREADALAGVRGKMQANPEAKLHRFSTTVTRIAQDRRRISQRHLPRHPRGQISRIKLVLSLARTGSHSDLF